MLYAKRIYTFRNNKNQIFGYKIEDETGFSMNVTAEDLKTAIRSGKINITNMTLTSDGRLVESNNKNSLESVGKTIFKSSFREEPYDMVVSKKREKIRQVAKDILTIIQEPSYNGEDVTFSWLLSSGPRVYYGVIPLTDIFNPKGNIQYDVIIWLEDVCKDNQDNKISLNIGLIKKSEASTGPKAAEGTGNILLDTPIDLQRNTVRVREFTENYAKRILYMKQIYLYNLNHHTED